MINSSHEKQIYWKERYASSVLDRFTPCLFMKFIAGLISAMTAVRSPHLVVFALRHREFLPSSQISKAAESEQRRPRVGPRGEVPTCGT